MKVYVVVRAFESHDMFVANKQFEEPRVWRVYTTFKAARAAIRKDSDDYVEERMVIE